MFLAAHPAAPTVKAPPVPTEKGLYLSKAHFAVREAAAREAPSLTHPAELQGHSGRGPLLACSTSPRQLTSVWSWKTKSMVKCCVCTQMCQSTGPEEQVLLWPLAHFNS